MRVFVTGATGFIGGHVARRLRERGDEVRVLARSSAKAAPLVELGCEPVIGDLGDSAAIAAGLDGAVAAIHGAAIYEVGIPASEHRRMYEANVLGTETVLRAALEARTPKVVYVSTIAAYGNTHGQVVDETYEHPGHGFTSYYEQTKYEAHRLARHMMDEEGLPCVIVQPGGVYGPGDHSAVGKQISDFAGGRLPLLPFPDLGMNLVHVEDVADGILLALDHGEPGQSYNLGGQIATMRELIGTVAELTGRRPPRGTLPTGLLKALRPAGPVVGKVMGQPPNLAELISSADEVTFWAKHDKAIAELGYSPRGLERGLRETLAAEGKL
jgi:nucleoside-diphosphate-sugar epimerase